MVHDMVSDEVVMEQDSILILTYADTPIKSLRTMNNILTSFHTENERVNRKKFSPAFTITLSTLVHPRDQGTLKECMKKMINKLTDLKGIQIIHR